MILTEAMLRDAAQEAQRLRRYYTLSESLTHFDTAARYDLFISHSFSDKELVIGLLHLFSSSGYTVYIDWIEDSSLDRSNVTPRTAALIRQRITQSQGTSYIATTNSTQSKWCPWELGVSDGMKERVCILPVMYTLFKGQEYLGLYPYLEYHSNYGMTGGDFRVYDQQNHLKNVSLRNWLNGEDPSYH